MGTLTGLLDISPDGETQQECIQVESLIATAWDQPRAVSSIDMLQVTQKEKDLAPAPSLDALTLTNG